MTDSQYEKGRGESVTSSKLRKSTTLRKTIQSTHSKENNQEDIKLSEPKKKKRYEWTEQGLTTQICVQVFVIFFFSAVVYQFFIHQSADYYQRLMVERVRDSIRVQSLDELKHLMNVTIISTGFYFQTVEQRINATAIIVKDIFDDETSHTLQYENKNIYSVEQLVQMRSSGNIAYLDKNELIAYHGSFSNITQMSNQSQSRGKMLRSIQYLLMPDNILQEGGDSQMYILLNTATGTQNGVRNERVLYSCPPVMDDQDLVNDFQNGNSIFNKMVTQTQKERRMLVSY